MSTPDLTWFTAARFGLFIHYSLFSMLERGEWVMNRERLSHAQMRQLAAKFNPVHFDAPRLCDLALTSGMNYINLTTMHHEGFRLYDTELSDFNSKAFCGRDLVEELVTAARASGLRIALYHSLNNWFDQPDACAALESRDAYDCFIGNTMARLKELVTRFNPIDVLWYDGWWPFTSEQWQAEEMNAMVRAIQPQILFNGRNGLAGDFGTPEGHLSAPQPWRPWEACITFNDHWSYHRGDHNWKSPEQVVALLAAAAAGNGNLLFNIGPRGDGSVPAESVHILESVGAWVRRNGEAIFDTQPFSYALMQRGSHNGDWSHNGPFTLKGNCLYQLLRYWQGPELTIAGLQTEVQQVTLLGRNQPCTFTQSNGVVRVTGLPEAPPDPVCSVIRLDCAQVPKMYLGGGMRVPNVPHPPYDPCPSDINH